MFRSLHPDLSIKFVHAYFLQIYMPVLRSNDGPIISYSPHTFTSIYCTSINRMKCITIKYYSFMAYYVPTPPVNLLHNFSVIHLPARHTLCLYFFSPARWHANCICVAKYRILTISYFFGLSGSAIVSSYLINKTFFSRASSFWSFLQSKKVMPHIYS